MPLLRLPQTRAPALAIARRQAAARAMRKNRPAKVRPGQALDLATQQELARVAPATAKVVAQQAKVQAMRRDEAQEPGLAEVVAKAQVRSPESQFKAAKATRPPTTHPPTPSRRKVPMV